MQALLKEQLKSGPEVELTFYPERAYDDPNHYVYVHSSRDAGAGEGGTVCVSGHYGGGADGMMMPHTDRHSSLVLASVLLAHCLQHQHMCHPALNAEGVWCVSVCCPSFSPPTIEDYKIGLILDPCKGREVRRTGRGRQKREHWVAVRRIQRARRVCLPPSALLDVVLTSLSPPPPALAIIMMVFSPTAAWTSSARRSTASRLPPTRPTPTASCPSGTWETTRRWVGSQSVASSPHTPSLSLPTPPHSTTAVGRQDTHHHPALHS